MTTIISSNLVLSSEVQAQGNAGVIGYQNVLNVSNVTATSALATNPITSVANPATAYTWKSAATDAPNVVSYPGLTNAMPSPFDPSAWSGASDPDLSYQAITETNPSGQAFVGEFEYVGTSFASIATNAYIEPAAAGDYYLSIQSSPVANLGFRVIFRSAVGEVDRVYISSVTGSITSAAGGAESKITAVSNDYNILQIKIPYDGLQTKIRAEVYLYTVDSSGNQLGQPTIGDKIKCQAVFFGQAANYPAAIKDSGIIVTTQTAGQQIDYIGIARHNLDQVGLTITVKFNGITVIPASSVSSIQAILFLLNEATPDTVEIIIKGATVAPQIGVIYIGKALRLERNIYVGHTPILYSRDRTSFNGVSENGQYLGEVVVRQTNSTSVNLQNLTANWYRTELDPFFALKPRPPCFYAWRPEGYPLEVGYCWVEGKPNMSNQLSNGMVQCSFNMRGIV